MDFRLLGPLMARANDGSEVPLGGRKQRAVLALLLVNAGRVVETDHIIDELWPDAPNDASRKTAQAYVSRLRARFAEHGGQDVMQARPGGYLLDTRDHSVDARTFEGALAAARAVRQTEPEEAARLLSEALRLWHGRPFEDAYQTRELELEAARLEEQRLAAVEVWADAELASGRHREVLAELRREAEANPLKEHLWALLMLALYRSGRQGEALGMYVELARHLSEELGVEPSRELRDLQRRMLQQDPTLDPDPLLHVATRLASRLPRIWRRRGVVAAAIAVGAIVIVTASALVLRRTDANGASPRAGERFEVSVGATEIVAAGGRVWVLDETRAVLTAVALDGSSVEYDVPAPPSAIAAGMGHLWVVSEEAGSVAKVDANTGHVVGVAGGLDLTGAALAVGADAVWVIREHPDPFLRLDPITLHAETLWFRDGFGGPDQPGLTLSGGQLWGSNAYIGRVMTLDPEQSGSEDFAGDARIAEHAARSILSERGAVWFSQPTNGSVTRVDPATGAVTAIVEIGRTQAAGFGRVVAPYALSAGPGGIWVALPDDGKVVRLDDESGAVLAEIGLQRPTSITASGGYVWILDDVADELVQVLPETCGELPFIGRGADLRGCDLSGKVLVGLDLTGADLRWAGLQQAAAQRVNLTDADLLGADLAGAALDGVTWRRTRCPDGTMSERHGGSCARVRP